MNTSLFKNPQCFERSMHALTRAQLTEDLCNISRRRRGAALATAIRCGAPGYLDILAAESSDGLFQDASKLQEFVLQRGVEVGIDSLRAEFFDNASSGFKPAPLAEIGMYLLWSSSEDEAIDAGEFLVELALPRIPKKLGSSKSLRKVLITNYIYRGKFDRAEKWLKNSRDLATDFLLAARVCCSAGSNESGELPSESLSLDEFVKSINKSYCSDAPSKIIFDEASERFTWKRRKPNPDQQLISGVSFAVLIHAPSEADSSAIQATIDSVLRQLVVPSRVYVFAENAEHKQLQLKGSARSVVEIIECNNGLASEVLLDLQVSSEFEYFLCLYSGDLLRPEATQYLLSNLRENPISSMLVQALQIDESMRIDLWESINELPGDTRIIAHRESLIRDGGLVGVSPFCIQEVIDRLKLIDAAKVADTGLVAVIAQSASTDRNVELPKRMRDWRRFHSAYKEVYSRYGLGELESDGEAAGMSEHLIGALTNATMSAPSTFEIVIAGDWRKYGGPQKSMIEEIKALLKFGFKVGIMHLEASRFIDTKNLDLNLVIQGMINRGEVIEVNYDDSVSVDLLILRYPPILQVMPTRSSSLSVKRMFILANQAPSELDGEDIRYLVPDCFEAAKQKFNTKVSWVPQGPQVRDAIASYLKGDELEDFNLPGIVDPIEWSGVFPRNEFANRPIVGRHSRDNIMKWPEDPAVLRQVYPVDGSVDVRLMGGSRTPLSILGLDEVPEAWTSLPKDHLPVREFLNGLEYFVFYQHSNAIEAFGRAILEAIAANLVVILPPHYEPVFGRAAVYAQAGEVTAVIQSFAKEPERYREQQQIANDILHRDFTHEAYVRRISEVLSALK